MMVVMMVLVVLVMIVIIVVCVFLKNYHRACEMDGVLATRCDHQKGETDHQKGETCICSAGLRLNSRLFSWSVFVNFLGGICCSAKARLNSALFSPTGATVQLLWPGLPRSRPTCVCHETRWQRLVVMFDMPEDRVA
jgi:hypothetical protein